MGKYPRTTARRRALTPVAAPVSPPEPVPQTRTDIVAKPQPKDGEPCSYAMTFKAFAENVLAAVKDAKQSVHVNRAKVLLTDQYFRLRRTLPIEHQDCTNASGHPCVYGVFVSAYEALERKELEIVPIAFELPIAARPPSPKVPEKPPDPMNAEVVYRLILGDDRV